MAERLTEELICPICLELFTDPVGLDCGHNFCRACITECWRDKDRDVSCPECRKVFDEKSFKASRILANLVEKAREMKFPETANPTASQCREHDEPLKLFCDTDKMLICLICRDGRDHKEHNFMPINEAVKMFKDEINISLKALQEKKNAFQQVKQDQQLKVKGIQNQSADLIQHFQAEFVKLHQFLAEKEQWLIQEVENSKEKELYPMMKNIQKLESEICVIQNEIADLQAKLDQHNHIFLKDIKDFTDRVIQEHKDPASVSAVLSLGIWDKYFLFAVWKQMLKIINPVPQSMKMDQMDKRPSMILSPDLLSVRRIDEQQTNQTNTQTERLSLYYSISGSEQLTSGKWYWEVNVGNKTDWAVGVFLRKDKTDFWHFIRKKSCSTGNILLVLRSGKEYTIHNFDNDTSVLLSVRPRKIGVYLDYDNGQVSFYNADVMTLIYTVRYKFTKPVFPYFNPGPYQGGANVEPLMMCHY